MYGWVALVLGQLVAWPQVVKLSRQSGEGVSLLTYVLLLVSMTLYLVHAISIGDLVTTVSVALSYLPNGLIAATLVRRRRRLREMHTEVEAEGGRPILAASFTGSPVLLVGLLLSCVGVLNEISRPRSDQEILA